MASNSSRFDDVTRRAFMKRSLLAGALVLVPGLAACGTSDEDVFASGADTTTGDAATTAAAATDSTAAAATDSTAAATTAATEATPSDTSAADTSSADTSPAASGTAFPAGAELVVDFTFAAESGGRVQNPYIAVWIENEAEELVQTVSLWMKSGKGLKWLPDLKRWYSADQDRVDAGGTDMVDTISSATRVAGDYSVVWDGTDTTGAPVAQGVYHVCIEAAREHGPYELIREAVTIGTSAFSTELAPDGELTAASVSFVV